MSNFKLKQNGAQVQKAIDYALQVPQLSEAIADETTAREQAISDLKAQGVQQTPLFAESLDWLNENGDTSKVYVLPDEYIYSYILKTTTITPKNQVKYSIEKKSSDNEEDVIYNSGKGYKVDTRLSLSSGESGQSGYTVTGFIKIPYIGSTARFANFNTSTTSTNVFIIFYDKDFAWVGYLRGQNATNVLAAGECVIDSSLILDSGTLDGAVYFRISAPTTTGGGYLVTINEPLNSYTETVEGWHSTGHKFVPADYESDILDLKERVSVLEVGCAITSVEGYVVEEAERVAKNVYRHQNAGTFTFLAVSDAHYLAADSNIVASNVHAGQGMDLVRKNVNVDFAVCLGDNGCGSGNEGSEYRATIEMGIAEIRAFNACIDSAFRGIPNFRSVGNHDSLIFNYTFNGNDYLDSSELFPLYGAYNRGAVFQSGERERGYCYRDFEDWKVRVICMNTSDIQDLTPSDSTKQVYVSGTQGKWFAETLDLSSKTNAAEWSILILSHAPLDWGTGCIYLCDILKAYKEGGSGTVERDGVTISYNYSGKNAATIIGNCHGHNHNYQTDYLRRYVGDNRTEAIEYKRFCIPNTCFERTNEKGENDTTEVWDIEYGETTSYEKVAGTAEDTAFCVVTIDPIERKIYADHYGAGYDRVVDY